VKIRFVLVGEGSTDSRLVPLLETQCLRCGASEASGIAPELSRLREKVGKDVKAQVGAALLLEPDANMVFVHRDADSRSFDQRYAEIARGAAGYSRPVIGVVPIQETEAWLLLDEQAIRDIAGKPSGKMSLEIPKPGKIEDSANPKEILQRALVSASELKGRRLQKFKSDFPVHRARLFDRVDPDGPIATLAAWQELARRIEGAITALK
jgi:hypothetical protein